MNKLKLVDLHVEIEGKEILKGVNLEVSQGEVHALMGPNGSGKTTLAHVIFGDKRYKVTGGKILLNDEDITESAPDERAKKGLFLAFQAPVALPGVKMFTFLRSAFMSFHPEQDSKFQSFLVNVQDKAMGLSMDTSLLSRSVNDGFSGGERKKSEILQMSILVPKITVVDEIDSGLDVDALETVAMAIKKLAESEHNMGVLMITHYQRILKYIKPQFVHVLVNGKIVQSGGYDLALKIENKGYDWIKENSS